MVLRESAKAEGTVAELAALTDPSIDSGIAEGGILIEFADALLGADSTRLDHAREAVVNAFGADGLVGATSIVANFSRNDRIANATGIPLEQAFVEQSADFRERVGINQFKSAPNTLGR